MPEELRILLERARSAQMTRDEKEEQRRSFAYGNSKIENDRITRETIDREAEAITKRDGT